MINHAAINFSTQTLCLAKLRSLSYRSKCSQPIKLQDSLKCNIMQRKRDKVHFLHVDKQYSLQDDSILFGECGWVCLSMPKHDQSI